MPGEEPEENLNLKLVGNYSESTRQSMSILSERDINFELIYAVLSHIDTLNMPGAILIFLPGWNVIFALMKQLQQHMTFGKFRFLLNLFQSVKYDFKI